MMLPVMVLLAFLASVWWAMHLFAETTNSDAWNRADVWNVERVSELCKEMLTREDVLSACPSAQKHQRLRVDADIVYFPHLYKCSISVSALDAVSLYATIDVFPSSSQALERMKERTTEDYTHVLGNLLGMGENSALNLPRNTRVFLLQKNHAYAEITPTGGGMCPESELYQLGTRMYERMDRLPPFNP
ncbi:hypothetical protein A3B32_00170 [Candidatus Uhrbacteria bacterium RIFCSPLOWO2_01_FULL_53_9]|nr:MAG: hypothetical protein A3B32_00170 [Candidatus Uhrbacteria bacterium RIFCSPLOWO2_01_FULL_53_9]